MNKGIQILIRTSIIIISLILTVCLVEAILQKISNNKPISLDWLLKPMPYKEWIADKDTIFITSSVLRSIQKPKKTGQFVITTLGDSFVQGDPVPTEYNYPSVLNKLINHPSVRINNLGVGGFGPDQELALFFKYLQAGNRPNMVIWSFYTNDIYENYTQPVFDIGENNRLISISGSKNWIYKRQQMYDAIPLPRELKIKSRVINLVLAQFENQIRSQIPLRYKNAPETWSVDKLAMEMDEMELLSKKYNFTLLYTLIFPQAYYISPTRWSDASKWTVGDFKNLYPILSIKKNTLMIDFTKTGTNSAVLRDTNESIADAYFARDKREPLPRGVHHFNERGYGLFAHMVYDYLYEKELLPIGIN